MNVRDQFPLFCLRKLQLSFIHYCWLLFFSNIQLIDWSYMNFSESVAITTTVSQIKQNIADRHGRIINCKLYKESCAVENEMDDESKSLRDYDLQGGTKENCPTVRIIYDFASVHHDPVMLFDTRA